MYKISVCVVTYNQENYIRQCLQSIVEQKTNFDFEVIVGDDCSTDGTRAIVEEFAERYPGIVKPLLHVNNIGVFKNYRAVHGTATGEYVAHIDGDDYFLPGKLEKQVRLLDDNLSLSVSFHQLRMVDAAGQDTGRFWPLRAPKIFSNAYLIAQHPIVGHSSMMYRNGLLAEMLKEDEEHLDFRIFVELSLQGEIGYIDDCLGCYRVGVGISKSNKWLRHLLSTLDYAESKGVDKNIVDKGRANQLYRGALNAFYGRDYLLFKDLIGKSVDINIFSKKQLFLFKLRSLPIILNIYSMVYTVIRRIGFISDLKMKFK